MASRRDVIFRENSMHHAVSRVMNKFDEAIIPIRTKFGKFQISLAADATG